MNWRASSQLISILANIYSMFFLPRLRAGKKVKWIQRLRIDGVCGVFSVSRTADTWGQGIVCSAGEKEEESSLGNGTGPKMEPVTWHPPPPFSLSLSLPPSSLLPLLPLTLSDLSRDVSNISTLVLSCPRPRGRGSRMIQQIYILSEVYNG